MTIAQAERFYAQDEKKYELEKNKEILSWLKNSIDNGYHPFISLEGLQNLIDTIVNWYEIKYPEKELEYYEGIKFYNFQDIKKISNVMNFRQLLYRLSDKQLDFIEGIYCARGWSNYPIYKDGKVVGMNNQIFMSINKKNKDDNYWYRNDHFLVSADCLTGKVKYNYELEEYINEDEDVYLEDLLELFDNYYSDCLEYDELKESINQHYCDLELRHRILQLVALKLLYSDNTIPERGYERANRFINEFNKKLGLTLSTDEIDEIINRDYTNGEKWEFVLKTDIDDNGEEFSYWHFEDLNKKDKKRSVKQLVKSIFNSD